VVGVVPVPGLQLDQPAGQLHLVQVQLQQASATASLVSMGSWETIERL
jgi:hypothetical protein